MMHAAGDWWLGERPCSRTELVKSLADLRGTPEALAERTRPILHRPLKPHDNPVCRQQFRDAARQTAANTRRGKVRCAQT
jgi:hypothetical protein